MLRFPAWEKVQNFERLLVIEKYNITETDFKAITNVLHYSSNSRDSCGAGMFKGQEDGIEQVMISVR